ncbi:GNAT family N-acetyltransferase [Nanoarchaeota archaeon]
MIKDVMIIGDRIYLQNLTLEHASEEYAGWLNDSEVNRYLETRKATIDDLKQYIQKQIDNPNSLFVGVFDKESKTHIGNIKLEPIDWSRRTAVFGILIGDKNYWGKGIGTEATKLIVDFAFKSLDLKEIELGVISTNIPAIHVYKKVGFVIDRVEKNKMKHGNKLYDRIVMKIRRGSS